MVSEEELQSLVDRIRHQLPEAARHTDRILAARGYDESELGGMPLTWIDALADTTNDAAREKDATAVQKQAVYMSEEYRKGSQSIRYAVEVSYAENLMWNLSDEESRWAWALYPQVIKDLYVRMWGQPDF